MEQWSRHMSRGYTQKKEKSLHFSTFNGTFSLFFEQRDLPFHWALHTMQPALSITFHPPIFHFLALWTLINHISFSSLGHKLPTFNCLTVLRTLKALNTWFVKSTHHLNYIILNFSTMATTASFLNYKIYVVPRTL